MVDRAIDQEHPPNAAQTVRDASAAPFSYISPQVFQVPGETYCSSLVSMLTVSDGRL
jgi:hypothetical protein